MPDERAHLRIGGVPVRVDWSFWLLAVFLGYGAREGWLLVAWVAIVLVSILVHELGHAFMLRAYQQQPHVLLYAFGGVTVGSAGHRSRTESIAVSIAGPLAALLLLGFPAYLLKDGAWAAESYNRYVIVHDIAWVNIVWSVANLMPVLPLDGGNIAAVILGERPARMVAVVVAGLGALYFFETGNQFGGMFALLFGIMNFASLAQERHPAAPRSSGQSAAQAAARSPAQSSPRPVRIADVGRVPDDLDSLTNAYLVAPSGASDLAAAVAASRAGKVLPLATRLLQSGPGGPRAAASLQSHLHYAGCFADAAAVAQLLYTDGRAGRVQPAFDAATALARAGDDAYALEWLNRSIDEGLDSGALLDGEPDLASLRTLAAWPAIRARVP
ncbi:MAG TPA: hypothetical protein VGJ03_07470 [Acidimicrobiales bacterium]|jgi:Zn-dependent protease